MHGGLRGSDRGGARVPAGGKRRSAARGPARRRAGAVLVCALLLVASVGNALAVPACVGHGAGSGVRAYEARHHDGPSDGAVVADGELHGGAPAHEPRADHETCNCVGPCHVGPGAGVPGRGSIPRVPASSPAPPLPTAAQLARAAVPYLLPYATAPPCRAT